MSRLIFWLEIGLCVWACQPTSMSLGGEPAQEIDLQARGKMAIDSLRSIQVLPGFEVEVAAAEPLITDPIAFEWGADGRLWVVQMGDYPLGVDGQGKPGGVVRVLEDDNGDGRYDRATTFLDGLSFPTGVMPWRSGVLIACAPDIFFAEDRDGDGCADHREVLFTGFHEGNQQHRVNGFEMGLEGWVYGANGDSGGRIRSLKTGKITPIGGRDFRFQPDTGEFEAESGQTQYGRRRNDWGDWFGNNNPTWGWHYVLSERDLRRNPYLPSPAPGRFLEPETRLFPVSRPVPRFNDPGAANHVTSANSFTPYRDELFGPEFARSAFVSEPVHNLVHRMILEPDGPTFRGRRGQASLRSEFLASSDNWFRPTMLRTGPDGALWIADMYRGVIEHPEWIPDEREAKLDLRAGSDQGRIYRVYPVGNRPRPIPRLDRCDTAGLVAAMDSPSGWQRDTAERLIVERKDRLALAPQRLRSLVVTTKRGATRVQAIWTLAALGALDPTSALAGLTDIRPDVRRAVVRAAMPLFSASDDVAKAVLVLANDADPAVRLAVALGLGDTADHRAGEALATIARRDAQDEWIRAAVSSSAVPHAGTILASLTADEKSQPPIQVIEPLLTVIGSLSGSSVEAAIRRLAAEPAGRGGRYALWQFAAVEGLLVGRERARQPIAIASNSSLEKILESARRVALEDTAPEPDRLAAIKLLGHAVRESPRDRDVLLGMVRPRVASTFQLAALGALARTADSRLPGLLLGDWNGRSPRIQQAILDLLSTRPSWTAALLSSLEDGCVPPAQVDPAHRDRLLSNPDGELRSRAQAVFSHRPRPRDGVVNSYRSVLEMQGDRTAGRAVFKKLCASCHRFGEEGATVGPDIASLKDRSPAALLIAILDPNRAYESRYAGFTIATSDGRVFSGLIAGESATTITLRGQDGKETALLRSEIDTLAATGQSLMPDGLEKNLTPREIADLIAYIAPGGSSREAE